MAVGQVLGAFGARGELRVRPLSRYPQRFRELRRVFVGDVYAPAAVLSRRFRPDDLILRLDTLATREAAAALHGAYLYVPEADAIPLPPGEYFVHQIVGLDVVSTEGESLGTIVDVLETGSNDVYVVDRSGRELLVPATKEVVKRVDLDAGTIQIELLPGLLD